MMKSMYLIPRNTPSVAPEAGVEGVALPTDLRIP